jgi:hypothetical protein
LGKGQHPYYISPYLLRNILLCDAEDQHKPQDPERIVFDDLAFTDKVLVVVLVVVGRVQSLGRHWSSSPKEKKCLLRCIVRM